MDNRPAVRVTTSAANKGCFVMNKQCSQCQETKPIDKFYKKLGYKFGVSAKCKECIKRNKREKYHDDADASRERQRQWRLNNPEKVAGYKKRDYELNGDKQKEKKRRRYQEDTEFRDAAKKRAKEWARKNKKAKKRNLRLWRLRNKKRWNAIQQQHRWRNIDRFRSMWRVNSSRRRAILADAFGNFSIEQWEDLKKEYNYTCLRCKKSEPEIKLTIDHVIPLSLGGNNDILNIQPLCGACNSSKNATTVDYRATAAGRQGPATIRNRNC